MEEDHTTVGGAGDLLFPLPLLLLLLQELDTREADQKHTKAIRLDMHLPESEPNPRGSYSNVWHLSTVSNKLHKLTAWAHGP